MGCHPIDTNPIRSCPTGGHPVGGHALDRCPIPGYLTGGYQVSTAQKLYNADTLVAWRTPKKTS